MSVLRFMAIGAIFGAVSVAWLLLAAVTFERTEQMDKSLSAEMESLWGPPVLAQAAPWWSPNDKPDRSEAGVVTPSASTITANFTYEPRRKGLLWYGSYTVDFAARYTIPAIEGGAGAADKGYFHFHLPAGSTPVDLSVTLDGQAAALPYEQRISGKISLPLTRQGERVVKVAFKTKGQDAWMYCPGDVTVHRNSDWGRDGDRGPRAKDIETGTGELRSFDLTITTDFRRIDYPRGSQSPTRKAQPAAKGMTASWKYQSLITRQPMGMVMPTPDNAGPVITRMSLFAPVSLFFFFTALFAVVVLRKIPLHPMHYLFVSVAFLAFHLLLAYLADKVQVEWSFWISAAVSAGLVVTYMRLVAGVKFACTYVAAAQLVYLVGFSYAFFWTGWTGLTVVIGAIVTLFVLMQATGRVDWREVFRRPAPAVPPIPPIPPAAAAPLAPEPPAPSAEREGPITLPPDEPPKPQA
ncbi:MAG: inner membrane CreD family protein [Planctomycetota bacterium]|jgi:hypothetical protein